MLPRGLLGLTVTAVLISGSLGRAEDASRAEARRLNSQAEIAKKHGDYRGALESLTLAYRLFPSINLRYNIAAVLAQLGRDAEAADEYEAFLTGTEGASRERAAAAAALAELDGKIAKLHVAGSAGAEVSIDGRAIGTLPLARPARVMPGAHVLLINRPGLAPSATRIELGAGETQTIESSPARAEPEAARPSTVSTAPEATPLVEPTTVVPSPPSLAARPPAERPARRGRALVPGLVGGGALLAIGLGGGLLGGARSLNDRWRGECGSTHGVCDPDPSVVGPRVEIAGFALLGIGGAAAVLDAVLWARAFRRRGAPGVAEAAR